MADDIRQWLEELGLGKYGDVFVENDIEFDLLAELSDEDLKDIGVASLGHRRRLLRAIAQRNDNGATPTSDEVADMPEQRSTAAERRQLTVMFCDLVGSTALSRQLDPEDLRDVMRRYQDAVASSVTRYGGHVAKYLGDGVLAYFGWPQAYEDQAERAVRSGLDAVEAVNDVEVGDGHSLEARVGISTGQVVVGDLVGESGRDTEAVTGETPNLAARLQGVAEPGQVVIGDTTRQLIGQTFALNDMGEQDLKGFEDGLQAWTVAGEQVVETRFEAAHQGSLTRIVGRDGELQLLLDRWELAKNGEGQVVLICGEPGIGKSRLSQALRDALGEDEHVRIRYQCSPYHTNSALYPTIQQLQFAASFEAADDSNTKLDKLESLLRWSHDDIGTTAPLFANLLSLPFEDRYGPLEQAPSQIKLDMLQAVADEMLRLAVQQPVLFLLEDAHWIDPTSLELLQLTVGRINNAPVLIVVTHRPEWQSPFAGDNVTSLQLNRLGKAQGTEIVRAIAGEHVPDDVIERIVSRTDGVPLFVEELTKSLVEGGLDIADADIPATLQASLMARLDRLGSEAKGIAQTAAVIGRQFSLNLLAAAVEYPPARTSEAIRRLVAAELVFQIDGASEAEYIFKHALIMDAAYDSILRDDRRRRHGALARILQENSGASEMVAEHYRKAGEASQAADYWYRAAQHAVMKSANIEASNFCKQSASQLAMLPETKENKRRLLAVLILDLQPTIFLLGYSSPEVAERAERALVICRDVGSDDQLFRISFYRWAPLHSNAVGAPALDAAKEYLNRALATDDGNAIIIGHRLIGTSLYMNGYWNEAREHLLRVVEQYRPDRHDELAMQVSQDVLVAGQVYHALTLWSLGWPEKALALFEEIFERAAKLEHINTLVFARFHLVALHMLMRTQDKFHQQIRTISEQVTEAGNLFASGFTKLVLADVDFCNGASDLDAVECCINDLVQRLHTYYGCQPIRQSAAEFCMAQGRFDEAERLIDTMERDLEAGYEVYRTSELIRTRGNYHLTRGNAKEGEACFLAALNWSSERSAKFYELRAAMSLAKLWQEQDKLEQAYDLMRPLFNWFTEGFDTPDLIEAKALLDELGNA